MHARAIRSFVNAAVLAFLILPVRSLAQTVTFHDDFNRPNSTSVNNVWSEKAAPVSSIAEGALRFTVSPLQPGQKAVLRPSCEAQLNQDIQVVFAWRAGAQPVVCARVQSYSSPNCYAAVVSQKQGIGIGRVRGDAGAVSLFATAPAPLIEGARYVLVMSVRGSDPTVTLRAKLLQVASAPTSAGEVVFRDGSPDRLRLAGTVGLSAGQSSSASYDAVTVIATDAQPARPQPDLPPLTGRSFTDTFDRPVSPLVGGGWVEANPVVSSCAGGVLLLSSTGARFTSNLVYRPLSEASMDGEASARFLYRSDGSEIPMLFVRARTSPSVSGYLVYLQSGRFGLARLNPGDSSFSTLACRWAPLGAGYYRVSVRCIGVNPVRLFAELQGTDPLGSQVRVALSSVDYSEARITAPGVPALSIHISGSLSCDDFSFTTERRGTTVLPNNPAIWYYGRWNTTDPAVRITVNPGTGLVVRFTGRTCTLLFDTTWNAQPMPTIWVRVDTTWSEHTVAPAVAATPQPLESSGPHEVEVVFKAVDPAQNRWLDPPVAALYFRGLELDENAEVLPPPPPPALKFEFLGDSVAEGYAIFGPGGPAGNDAMMAFPSQTGKLLNAECWITAFGGQGVSRPSTRSKVPKAAESFPWTYSGIPKPSGFIPDVVVINEGTNDAGYPDDVVREDYAELIAEVREAYPSAAILCMRPLAGTKAEAIRAAVQMASAFDPLVLYVDTTNWLRAADFLDDVHPNLAGHVRAAVLLASVIREVLDKYRMIAW